MYFGIISKLRRILGLFLHHVSPGVFDAPMIYLKAIVLLVGLLTAPPPPPPPLGLSERQFDYEIITAPDRLDKIAADFIEHCSARWQSGKSMLVCVLSAALATRLTQMERWTEKLAMM